jgi:hypothetical protein
MVKLDSPIFISRVTVETLAVDKKTETHPHGYIPIEHYQAIFNGMIGVTETLTELVGLWNDAKKLKPSITLTYTKLNEKFELVEFLMKEGEAAARESKG